MGISKTELFTPEQNELASMVKAIAHPARIAILEHLARRNSCVCGELVIEIGLSQPTVSQHLKALKKAGLIQGTIEGASVCYCIDPGSWERLRSTVGNFLEIKISEPKCC